MIKLAHIHKYYYSEEETLHVLDDINLQVDAGEFLAIMGPSGSGKSTLINLLGFIDKKFEGTYLFEDREIGDFSDKELSRIRNEAVGFVFQNFSLIETLTVEENIELPLLYSGLTPKEAKDRVHEVLTKVGLPDKGKKHPKQLSGGQQQRVAIARSLVSEAPVILADEPTGNLDPKTAGDIVELLKSLAQKTGKCVIVVTHSKEVAQASDITLELKDKKLTETRNTTK